MHDNICSFCGHRIVTDYSLEEKIYIKVLDLVMNKNCTIFYSGGMGEFDMLCERVVRRIKKKYPYIKLCRIIYKYKTDLKAVRSLVDEIIIPDLTNVHYKKAIVMRNRWMVEEADMILCYIHKSYGGAYTMMKYAEKTNTEIIRI